MSEHPARRGRGGQEGHEPRARIRTRELRAMELTIQGWSQHRIAADLGVSQPAVSKILKRVENRVLRELAAMVERQKARHTMRLEHLYGQAIEAWEESKADVTRRRQRKTQGRDAGGGATIAEVVTENQHGDPRYLEEARKTVADLRKLWGSDAAQKLDIHASTTRYDAMTEEELRTELARKQALLGASAPIALPPIASGPNPSASGAPTSTNSEGSNG
jgi:predicted transcriptional regulator